MLVKMLGILQNKRLNSFLFSVEGPGADLSLNDLITLPKSEMEILILPTSSKEFLKMLLQDKFKVSKPLATSCIYNNIENPRKLFNSA